MFSVCSNKVPFPLRIWHTLRHLVSKNNLIVKYVGISCTYIFLTHMMKLQFICLLKPYPHFKSFFNTSQMGDICKGKQTFQTLYQIPKLSFNIIYIILNTFTLVHLVIMNIILVSSCSQSTSLSFTMKTKYF